MDKIFTTEFKQKADAIVLRYEVRRAAILEILRLIQENVGHISLGAETEVAEYLGIPAIDVREVMTFYSLFYDKPKARTRFQVCRTLTCSLLGGEAILRHLEQKLGVKAGQITPDGDFSFHPVECLGACEIAPMMQVSDGEYVGNLTPDKVDKLITRHSEAEGRRI